MFRESEDFAAIGRVGKFSGRNEIEISEILRYLREVLSNTVNTRI